jgi:hypothetical protein
VELKREETSNIHDVDAGQAPCAPAERKPRRTDPRHTVVRCPLSRHLSYSFLTCTLTVPIHSTLPCLLCFHLCGRAKERGQPPAANFPVPRFLSSRRRRGIPSLGPFAARDTTTPLNRAQPLLRHDKHGQCALRVACTPALCSTRSGRRRDAWYACLPFVFFFSFLVSYHPPLFMAHGVQRQPAAITLSSSSSSATVWRVLPLLRAL